MDISVVLATYNRASSLRLTLSTFSLMVYSRTLSWELIVVDNNSRDSTREVVGKFAESVDFPVRYIFEKVQGRSAALNTGIANATGDIIAFTDDDVIIDPGWLSNLKGAFESYDCSAVAGRVVPQWNHPKPDWLEMDGQIAVVNFEMGDKTKEITTPPLGANSAFRSDVFKKYGMFRLDLGVKGTKHTITCDDTEFGERLIRGGEKVVYCPKAIVYHPVEPSRTTKKYFLSWYYYNGVSMTRTTGRSKESVRWFGVPRWLYRELLANCRRWILCSPGKLRFHYKLQTYRSVGNIVESYRLSRREAAIHVSQQAKQI